MKCLSTRPFFEKNYLFRLQMWENLIIFVVSVFYNH